MNPEALAVTKVGIPEISSPTMMGAIKASMVIHPVLWTLGAVVVVGAIGYFAFFRKSTLAEVKAS